MKKPVFSICENKGSDQLHGKCADQLCDNCTADKRLCFSYIDSTIPLFSKSQNSSFLPSSVAV